MDYEINIENNVTKSDLNDKLEMLSECIAGVSDSVNSASNKLKALTDILNVDKWDLMEATIIEHVKDRKEGGKSVYDGDLCNDIILLLKHNRDLIKDLKKSNEVKTSDIESLTKEIKTYRNGITKALCVTNGYYNFLVIPNYENRKKYKGIDINNDIEMVINRYKNDMRSISKVLNDDQNR